MRRPPRLASALLVRWLNSDDRDEFIGDLDEEFARHVERNGLATARRWYWRQALGLVWALVRGRPKANEIAHDRSLGQRLVGGVGYDVRSAVRSLRHSPGFVALALLTLTLAIALSTVVYSFVDGVLLRPLPYPHSDRLVRLAEFRPGREALDLSSALGTGGSLGDVTLGVWLDGAEAIEYLTPYSVGGRNVQTAAAAERVSAGTGGGHFFELFPVKPVSGRLLGPGDTDLEAPAAAVVSQRLWRHMLGGRPAAVGSPIRIEGETHTIVGIAPDVGFPSSDIDVWLPGRWYWPSPGGRRNFSTRLSAVARLADGSTLAAARREGQYLLDAIAMADPVFDLESSAVPAMRVRRLLDDTVARVRAPLLIMLTGMSLVLVGACANLANLLVARHTARTRELAVRLALGASWVRIARAIILEQGLLVGFGAALGVVLAWWVLASLPMIVPADVPRLANVELDLLAFAGTTTIVFLAALGAALLPAWRFTGGRPGRRAGLPGRAGPEGGALTGWTRHVLVVGQVALAVVLMVGATLVGRSLAAMQAVPPGFEPAHILTFQVSPPSDFRSSEGRVPAFLHEVLARLEADPRVVAAGAASVLPLHPSSFRGTVAVVGLTDPDDPGGWPIADQVRVTASYLPVLGTRTLRGRTFGADDRATAEHVAIIDAEFERRYFPGEDLVGRHVEIGRRTWTIVGVIEPVQVDRTTGDSFPTIYVPSAQYGHAATVNRYGGGFALRVARDAGDPQELVGLARKVVTEVEPLVPVFNAMPLADRFYRRFDEPRFYTVVLALFAVFTLATSVLGVYGLLAYVVEQRRVEFGVRQALGASRQRVVWLVVRRTLLLVGAGLAAGLSGAAVVAGLMRSLLFGIEPFDFGSFIGVAVVVSVVALAASWLPARRAFRANPIQALRAE